MRKALLSTSLFVLTLGLLAGPLLSEASEQVPAGSIVISPSTINLDSQAVWVTVHADIAYRDVVVESVTLNGISVEKTLADAQGELVAKFCVDAVKPILELGTVPLTLECDTTDGFGFTGTDTIEVIEVSGGK